ncbi:Essential protein Yae1, N terminal [Saccharomyces cerevisiae]|nr:Yae1p [Saccharomyces cerevisiae YJM193]AJR72190.1 Yae1p [Saccharomyces cerevisiae YJM1460]AJR75462.1 Yae1p [Saccharomyces cerevisiae YJM1592]AJV44351.1 Yae1p [Saccharomyces cerevisiae YJM1388]AJV44682.1 Yae1p [Saccharomyces cerevisiae YJM1389]CAI4565953.1 ALH_1c_G0030410.mRNA.1.CDS.1 [Saccharomyces cerevisiae]
MSNTWDDVWASDSDVETERSPDLLKLRENHSKRGYLDGIVSSKEEKLQEGFNDGFPTGAKLGKQVGIIMGVLLGLRTRFGDEDEGLSKAYIDAQKELRINKVLSKSIFDPNFDLQEKHPLITKWTDIVNTYCEKYHVPSIQ